MDTLRTFLIAIFLILFSLVAFAQDETEEEVPSYQTMYDDPYDIRNLYIQFQPLYGDVGALNITGGFGIEGAYYHKAVFDAQLAFRTSYGRRFDLNRHAATKNNDYNNSFPMYYNLEFGGTYHIQDRMKESSSQVLLYSKHLKGTEWASTVAKSAEINGKVRTVIGGRLGGALSSTTVNITGALESQGKELSYADGTPVLNEEMYSHVQSFLLYVGGSYSMIRNYAVEFSERWDPSGDDMIFTPYFDLLFAPSVNVSDIILATETVSSDPIDKLKMGFRGGLNIKFNRKWSWGTSVETGVKPGIKKRGFFLVFKMSFPIYGKKIVGKTESSEEADN